jgi:hypothetical protein
LFYCCQVFWVNHYGYLPVSFVLIYGILTLCLTDM